MVFLADFAPRRVGYAGEVGDRWFVSGYDDGTLIALNQQGETVERWPLPGFVHRVVDVRGALLGIDWEYAWGRRWGHSTVGSTEEARGYDLGSRKAVWKVDALWGYDAGLGIGIASNHAFDLRTGAKLWTVSAEEAAVVFDDAFVFVQRDGGKITAYEHTSGREAWHFTPGEGRRVLGFLGRSLALFDGGLWYVGHPSSDDERAIVVRLDPRSGRVVAEYPFPELVVSLHATSSGVLLHRGNGLSLMEGDGIVESIGGRGHIDAFSTDGRSFAFLGKEAKALSWTRARDLERVDLFEPWGTLRVDATHATLARSPTEVLRFSLDSEPFTASTVVTPVWESGDGLEPATVIFAGPAIVLAEHARRGRFTMHAANTGLAKGASVRLGGFVPGPTNTIHATKLQFVRAGETVNVDLGARGGARNVYLGSVPKKAAAKKSKAAAASPIRKLVDALVKAGLMDAMTPSAQTKMAKRVFPDGKVGDDGKALLLQYVHGLTGGLSRGFLAHDRRFERETDDVIAELSTCLGEVPITLAQIGKREGAVHVRAGGEDRWLEGLDAIVAFVNEKLAAAGTKTRIDTLKTSDEWHAFVVSRR